LFGETINLIGLVGMSLAAIGTLIVTNEGRSGNS
jgi:drug/metabolite transporter (DMT)-like permease